MVEHLNTLPHRLAAHAIVSSQGYSDLNNSNTLKGGIVPPHTIPQANTLCSDNVLKAYTLCLDNTIQSQSNQTAVVPQRRDNTIRSSKIISLDKALSIRANNIQIDRDTFLKFRTQPNQTQPPHKLIVQDLMNTKKNTSRRKKRKVWIKTTNTLNSKPNSLSSGNNSNGSAKHVSLSHSLSEPPRGTPGEQDSVWRQVYLRSPRIHTCSERKKIKENLDVNRCCRSETRRKNVAFIGLVITC